MIIELTGANVFTGALVKPIYQDLFRRSYLYHISVGVVSSGSSPAGSLGKYQSYLRGLLVTHLPRITDAYLYPPTAHYFQNYYPVNTIIAFVRIQFCIFIVFHIRS